MSGHSNSTNKQVSGWTRIISGGFNTWGRHGHVWTNLIFVSSFSGVQISHVAGDLASGLEFPPTLVAPASILRRRKAVSEPNGFRCFSAKMFETCCNLKTTCYDNSYNIIMTTLWFPCSGGTCFTFFNLEKSQGCHANTQLFNLLEALFGRCCSTSTFADVSSWGCCRLQKNTSADTKNDKNS